MGLSFEDIGFAIVLHLNAEAKGFGVFFLSSSVICCGEKKLIDLEQFSKTDKRSSGAGFCPPV